MTISKAAIVHLQGNELERKDALIWKKTLEEAGKEVDVTRLLDLGKEDSYLSVNWSSYDLIGIFPNFNALFQSAKNHRKVMKHIAQNSKPGALALILCDIALNIDPFMWDKEETSKEKENAYAYQPMKVLASFSEKFLEDSKAMDIANKRWMKKLHPGSSFHSLEWLSFYSSSIEDEMESKIISAIDSQESIYPNGIPDVNGFYYGLDKSQIAKNLKEEGFGTSEGDTVLGKIGKRFKKEDYPLLSYYGADAKTSTPDHWIPLAQNAKKLYVPYEPFKGDYQFTKRFLEAELTNPEASYYSSKISPDLLKYRKISEWKKTSDLMVERLDTIF